MIEAFASSIVRHRARWTVGALLLLAVALVLGTRLSLRQELSDMVPRVAPADSVAVPELGGADRIVVLLEAREAMTPAEIGPALDSLAERLAAIPGMRRVEHRLAPQLAHFLETEAPRHLLLFFSPAELDTLATRLSRAYMERALLGLGEPIPRTPLARALGIERTDPLGVVDPALAKLREAGGAGRVKLVEGYFAVPDQRAFFLTLEPAERIAGVKPARAIAQAIDSAFAAARRSPTLAPVLAGKRLVAVGRPIAVVQGFDLVVADVQRVAIAATLVVLGLLILCLRRLLAPLFIVGTVAYGIALTAGVAFLLFDSINAITWVFLASLIGFGDEFALYVVSHYWLTARPGSSRAEAVAAAIRRPGPGILLGGLTSAAAFFSLVVVSYPLVTELAWLLGLGLLLILGCSLTVLPLGLAYTRPGRDAATGWPRWTGLADRLGRLRPRLWWVGWGALVLGSLWLARTLRFELHPWKLAARGVPVTAELEQISRRLGASFTPFLMVSRGTTEAEALAADRAAVGELRRIKDLAGVAAIVSLSSWLPAPEQQAANLGYLASHAERFSAERFRRDFLAVTTRMAQPDTLLTRRYLPLVTRYLAARPQPLAVDTLRRLGLGELVDRHLVRRGDEHFAITEVYLNRIPWIGGPVEQFNGTIAREGGPALSQARFVGEALRSATHSATLKRDMTLATALALSFILLVLVARFRRPGPVLLCLAPLACGASAGLGVMAILGIEVNALTLAVTPLIVGLGIDDGIHMVDRLERGAAVAEVIAETGAPMIITTLTTIAAFACLGFARFPGVAEVGLVAAVGLLVCLVASLQLVPMAYKTVSGER